MAGRRGRRSPDGCAAGRRGASARHRRAAARDPGGSAADRGGDALAAQRPRCRRPLRGACEHDLAVLGDQRPGAAYERWRRLSRGPSAGAPGRARGPGGRLRPQPQRRDRRQWHLLAAARHPAGRGRSVALARGRPAGRGAVRTGLPCRRRAQRVARSGGHTDRPHEQRRSLQLVSGDGALWRR